MHGHILCKQVEEAGRGGRPNLQQPLNRLIQQPTRFPHWYMLVGQCNPAVPHRATMSVARYRPCSSAASRHELGSREVAYAVADQFPPRCTL